MSLINEKRSAHLCLIKIEQFNALLSILNPSQSSKIITTVALSLEREGTGSDILSSKTEKTLDLVN